MRAIASGAADVDDVIFMIEMHRGAAQRPSAGRDFAHGFSAQPHGRDGGGDLSWRRFAAKTGRKEGVGVFTDQGSAIGKAGKKGFEGLGHRRLLGERAHAG
jgi:hypothetical protein